MVLDNLMFELEDVGVPMSSVDVGKYAKHSELSCKVLTSLYCDDGASSSQIAGMFGCSKQSVLAKLCKCGIARRRYVPTTFVFSDAQKQVFDGCMLGDGGLTLGDRCIHPYFCNVDKHKEYLLWLQNVLGVANISRIVPICHMHRLRTKVIPSLQPEYTRWYPQETRHGTNQNRNNKIIPKDIELTPTKVLFWYLGDGSYQDEQHRSYLNNALSFDEACSLIEKLKNLLNIDSGITVNCNHKRGYCFIVLNRQATDVFFDMVDTLDFDIPECYMYKFGKDV